MQESHLALLLHPEQRFVPLVPTKQLVTPVARQHNLRMLSRFTTEEVGWNIGRVCKRLIIDFLHAPQLVCNVCTLRGEFHMPGTIGLCGSTGVDNFAVIALEIEGE